MEMEASFLLHFARGCGYKAGVICPTIANRRDRAFADRYLKNIKEATEVAILAFYKLSV
jgi:uridine phosphorylase